MSEKTGVYAAIAAVSKNMATQGISKDRKNQQGSGYNFRGIDDVLNALSPSLVEHGLVIIPRCIERESVERQTKSGGAIFYTTVKVEFDFIAVSDGSKHTAVMYGEAMDTSDKSTNKAMSAAYKYVAFQTFCIPTEGDNDADLNTHEVAAKPAKTKSLKFYPQENFELGLPKWKENKEPSVDLIKRMAENNYQFTPSQLEIIDNELAPF